METPIALHSVAHRVPHQIPAESEMSRQNRATPPPNKGVAPSSGPPCRTFLSFAAGRVARGGVSRRAGGGYRCAFGFRKRIALQGGVAATVTPVVLLCATKETASDLKSQSVHKIAIKIASRSVENEGFRIATEIAVIRNRRDFNPKGPKIEKMQDLEIFKRD